MSAPATTRFDEGLSAAPVFRDDDGVARLLGSSCPSCGTVAFPRRHVCLACGGAPQPRELRGAGVVHAFADVANPPHGFAAGYRYLCVDLDEGGRVLAPATGDGVAIAVGARVQARVAPVRDDHQGFRFAEVVDA
ncbi:Zn-ribbon domain-containing OB-fold protein [Patulibacter defluvii]|uniref:Zn-ribbon domain-containing OB-fold protein n=1 Tax=Patulibacter defluvii TaxID=3095358 RepID=UPI002A7486C6|nr:zinc ribbon domain-containing protein [Patulibacter sp. DM4]